MDGNLSLIEEVRQRRQAGVAHDGDAGAEAEENAPAFGAYRGVRERSSHLEFQRLRGTWPALGYAWLTCLEWAPSGTGSGRGQAVVLHYATGHRVTLRGRNLRPLHERILRQQAYRVTEMGEEADRFAPEGVPVVYAIEVTAAEEATPP